MTTTSSGSRPASLTSTRPSDELARDLERGLAEQVEEAEVEGRAEGLGQPARGLCGRVVAEAGGCGEVLLDRIDVAVELHDDITMTS